MDIFYQNLLEVKTSENLFLRFLNSLKNFIIYIFCLSTSVLCANPVFPPPALDNNSPVCGLGLVIPDNGCFVNELEVDISVSGESGTQLGQDIILEQVDIIISHTWVSDVKIGLESPSGEFVVLSENNGGDGENYGDPADCPNTMASFRMNTDREIEDEPDGNLSGIFRPEDDFEDLNDGSNPNGTWTLFLCDEFTSDEGTLEYVKLTFATPPANDQCANALPISCGVPVIGTNLNATFDDDGIDCPDATNTVGGGVWYTWTGDGSCVGLTTCSPLTDYDTKISVYEGTCGSFSCVASNDDDDFCPEDGLHSTVLFSSEVGVQYYILVHGFSFEAGNFELTLSCSSNAHDNVCSAQPIGISMPALANGFCATAQMGEVSPGPGTDGFDSCVSQDGWCDDETEVQNSLWYSFVAPPEGRVHIYTTNFDDAQLALWSVGDCSDFGSFVEIAANDDSPSAIMPPPPPLPPFPFPYPISGGGEGGEGCEECEENFAPEIIDACVVPGQTYYVQIDGYDGFPYLTYLIVDPGTPVDLALNCPSPISTTTSSDGAGDCLASVSFTNPTEESGSECGMLSLTISVDGGAAQTVVQGENFMDDFAPGVHTVEYVVTDDYNSISSNCSFTVTVSDDELPSASCADYTVQLDASGTASIADSDIDGGSSDNCGIASLSASPNTFDCSNVGANNVTLTVTDVNGNPASCSATVSVEDNISPMASCQNITVQLDANGDASIDGSDIDSGSSDNCEIASLSALPNTFDCSNVGDNTVTLTVIDVNGNTPSTCSATVTVEDNVMPSANCKNFTVELDAMGNASIMESDIDDGSSDACGIESISASPISFDCSNVGGNVVTLTVTDVNGNMATCMATVMVEDNIDPTVACQSLMAELTSDGTLTVNPDELFDAAGSSDNCGTVMASSLSQSLFTCEDEGVNTIVLTAEDSNGNTSTCTTTVTIEEFFEIIAVETTDVTCPQAGDGTIDIEVDAPFGQIFYSVDGGATWQLESFFNFLSEGTYTIVVRLNGLSANCEKTTTAVIELDPEATVDMWYKDIDDDGHSDGVTLVQCQEPEGFKLAGELLSLDGDCNDYDENEFPGQVWFEDADADGYSSGNSITNCARPLNHYLAIELTATTGDCDDNEPAVNPSAVEICNGIDDDCDGEIDEEGTGGLTWVGNVSFTNQAQVEAFSQCYSIIQGNLTIMNSGVNDLSNLINLTEVTGYVYIKSTGLTSMAGLDNLTTIGGYLRIQSNVSLTTLDGLEAVNSVGGYLRVFYNRNLTDCCAIHALLDNGGVGGSVTILRNDTGCDNVSQINTACAGSSALVVVGGEIPNTVGIEMEEIREMNLFPNPAKEEVNIQIRAQFEQGILQVFDQMGRTVWLERLSKDVSEHKLNVSKWNAGVYFIHLDLDGQTLTQKLMVK